MEQDKQLKDILFNSAETAPAGFTDTVMQKVNGIAAGAFNYQPLVSPGFKRIFVFVFGGVTAAIFGLCLLIAMTSPPVVTWLQNISLPALDYRTILLCILSFWIVFAVNAMIGKKFFVDKKSQSHVLRG